MKTTRLPAAMLVTVLSVVSARADEPTLKGDLAKLQGRWTAKVGAENDMLMVMTIKGNAATFKVIPESGEFTLSVSLGQGTKLGEFSLKSVQNANFAGAGELMLDESAKPYKTIDWVKFTMPDGSVVENGLLSIYEFMGDDLKLCTGGPGERPSDFKAAPGSPPGLILFKRDGTKAAAGADEPPALKGDLAQIQGSWTAKVGPEKNIPLTVTFKGNAVTLKFTGRDGQQHELKGEVKLDETAQPHKTLDWVKFTRPNGEDAPENQALYELDGKTLTICSGGPGNARPTELKAGEGGPPNLIVLKKVE